MTKGKTGDGSGNARNEPPRAPPNPPARNQRSAYDDDDEFDDYDSEPTAIELRQVAPKANVPAPRPLPARADDRPKPAPVTMTPHAPPPAPPPAPLPPPPPPPARVAPPPMLPPELRDNDGFEDDDDDKTDFMPREAPLVIGGGEDARRAAFRAHGRAIPIGADASNEATEAPVPPPRTLPPPAAPPRAPPTSKSIPPPPPRAPTQFRAVSLDPITPPPPPVAPKPPMSSSHSAPVARAPAPKPLPTSLPSRTPRPVPGSSRQERHDESSGANLVPPPAPRITRMAFTPGSPATSAPPAPTPTNPQLREADLTQPDSGVPESYEDPSARPEVRDVDLPRIRADDDEELSETIDNATDPQLQIAVQERERDREREREDIPATTSRIAPPPARPRTVAANAGPPGSDVGAQGSLVIEAPADAIVFVNGAERGRGHLELRDLDRFAKHAVRVHCPGYLPWTGSVSLEGKAAGTLRPALKRRER